MIEKGRLKNLVLNCILNHNNDTPKVYASTNTYKIQFYHDVTMTFPFDYETLRTLRDLFFSPCKINKGWKATRIRTIEFSEAFKCVLRMKTNYIFN